MTPALKYFPASFLYGTAFSLALPFLMLSGRLRENAGERLGLGEAVESSVWMQAASGGEAFLAVEILKSLEKCAVMKGGVPDVLLSSGTKQGLEVLRRYAAEARLKAPDAGVGVRAFPFDHPLIVSSILKKVSPRALVLLETELWPGLFSQAGKRNIPLAIVNGRLSEKSLKGHMLIRGFWREFAPQRIMAVSESDAGRFAELFRRSEISVMPNIKFDRINIHPDNPPTADPQLSAIISPETPFIILASIRREESAEILNALKAITAQRPEVAIGFFPKHPHLCAYWAKLFARSGLGCVLRSEISEPVSTGGIILWDGFGELGRAYGLARTAFVGGSLRPLGGQNFLEPLQYGVSPVIGPYWNNFAWAGYEIVASGLVRQVAGETELVSELLQRIDSPPDRRVILKSAHGYISARRGGAEMAAGVVANYLA